VKHLFKELPMVEFDKTVDDVFKLVEENGMQFSSANVSNKNSFKATITNKK
jgi:hypothetical protein